MIKASSRPVFRAQLLAWFREFQRDLPWRRTRDPYHIWLSEIMLQQTRVAAVIPYYEKFLARFPDMRKLAEASPEEVLRAWSGLGYYSRARNLQKAARQIVAKHGGKFPRTEEKVLALAGIGNYTAAAILSIAFGAQHAALDGNVVRVLARLGAIHGDLRETRRWRALQKSADQLIDVKSPGDWNQALMELGATICTPRAPQCLVCPVNNYCRARKLGIAESLPEKQKKRVIVDVSLAAVVFADARGRCLLLPPPESTKEKAATDDVPTLVSRMWHFPTISVNGDPAAQLNCFLKGWLPSSPNGWPQVLSLRKVRHAVTYRSVTVFPFYIHVTKLPQIRGAKSVLLENLSSLPISNLTRKVARAALEATNTSRALEAQAIARTQMALLTSSLQL